MERLPPGLSLVQMTFLRSDATLPLLCTLWPLFCTQFMYKYDRARANGVALVFLPPQSECKDPIFALLRSFQALFNSRISVSSCHLKERSVPPASDQQLLHRTYLNNRVTLTSNYLP
ncbi:hypothetical protein BDV98DRAFT_339324 [Pterulicium gracile]|uniref:Uncharacterized protein n=1 Tax=Pterulicium gracile TaxID=1884261 RepID=A0A5C3Q525_9AGAR|nr:hypothetical protein BDV98DRAFT_339324 [Pterula gracilis]